MVQTPQNNVQTGIASHWLIVTDALQKGAFYVQHALPHLFQFMLLLILFAFVINPVELSIHAIIVLILEVGDSVNLFDSIQPQILIRFGIAIIASFLYCTVPQ